MAALTNLERLLVSSRFQDARAFGVLLKADVQAAVNALDAFLDSAAFITALNNQIPEPAKSALPAAYKHALVTLLLRQRLGL